MFLGRDVAQGLGKGTPGPGTYEGESQKVNKSTGFSFGARTQAGSSASASFAPGPGEYQGASASMMGPINVSGKSSSPSNKFTSSRRFNKIKHIGGGRSGGTTAIIYAKEGGDSPLADSVPSSMAHQMVSTKPSNPLYSFGLKIDDDVCQQNGVLLHRKREESDTAPPGPGQYHNSEVPISESLKSEALTTPKVSFGQGKRFNMKDQHAPGLDSPPAQYNTAGPTLTVQKNSKFVNSPRFTFGTDRFRSSDAKMRLDERHDFPGPGTYYGHNKAVGSQVVSSKSSAPQYSFGGSSRDDSTKMYLPKQRTADPNMRNACIKTPGPGAYRSPEASKYKKKTAYAYSFGLRTEFAVGERRPNTTPAVGPGAYKEHDGVGGQRVSTRKSAARFSMGTSTRSKNAFVVSPGSKTNSKSFTPGPGQYSYSSSFGRQAVSSQKSALTAGFGRGAKIKSARNTGIPGPGSYGVVDSTGRKQVRSTLKTAPSFGFGSCPRQHLEAGMVG